MEYISIIKEDVDLSKTHRYLRLPHPRTNQPQLYLPFEKDGSDGLLEVIKINGSHRRTWFIGDATIDAGTILIHYPVDPLFLVIPIVLALIPVQGEQHPFQPLSDLISAASTSSSFALHEPFSNSTVKTPAQGWNDDVARLLELKSMKRVLRSCCEKKVIPSAPPSPPSEIDSAESSVTSRTKSQKYYRPSLPLILAHLQRKAEHFAHSDNFGRFDHLVRSLGRDGLLDIGADSELVKSARLRAACEHLAQWLPPSTLSQLLATYDFSTLDTCLANRSAASLAASVAPSNASNKEGKVAGGKRKAPPASRGVEALKKVNTSSMNKLTSFFKPKEGGAAPTPAKKKK